MAIEVVRTPSAGPPEQPPGRSAQSAGQAGRAGRSSAHGGARPARGGPDPLSVALFSLALLMVLVALLAHQLTSAAPVRSAARVTLVRKIYRTRVIETIIGPGPSSAASVTQSVASSGSLSAAPVSTHTS